MAGALLYGPRSRWRIGAAFGAAALIHFAAIMLADRPHQVEAEATPRLKGDIPVDFLPPDSPKEESNPPPEDVVPPPMPVPVEEPIAEENRTIPPSVRRLIFKPIAPTVKAQTGATSGRGNFSSARALALSDPRPVYPYEARRQKITGSGIAMMTVDPATGNVIDVVMQESTGSPVLDNAAVTAFRRWRFKAGTGPRVRSPITFTLTGAQY